MLKRNSTWMFIQTLHSSQLAGRIGDFEIFSAVFLKAHACFDRPEYWMSAICIPNTEIRHFVQALYDKNNASYYCFTSGDV